MAKNLAVTVVIGGSLSSTFSAAFANAGATVRTLGATAKALGDKQKALGASIEKYAGTLAPKTLAGMHRDYQRLGQLIDEAKRKQEALTASMKRGAALRAQRGELIGSAMGTVAVGAAVAAPLVMAVRAARDFESAMADVRKVVDFKEPDGFVRLGKEIQAMATEIPRTQEELAAIAAAGGAAGIAEKDLKRYTEMVAKQSTAWEMSAEATGTAVAQVGNIWQMNIDRMQHWGDVVNKLADDGASSASQIIDVTKRIGGQAHQLGISEGYASALGTTMTDMGQSAEVAATSVNALFGKFSQATQQSKKFTVGLKSIGLSAKQLQADMARDAEGTVLKVLHLIAKLPKAQRIDLTGRLFGAEYADNMAGLIDNLDLLEHKLDSIAGDKANGSVEREFQVRAKTFENATRLFNNQMRNLEITVGSALIPALNDTLKSLTPLIQQFTAWAEKNPELIANITQIGAGLIGAKLAFTGLRLGVNLASTAVNTFSIATALLSGKWTVLKAAVQGTSFAPLIGSFEKATAAANGLSTAASAIANVGLAGAVGIGAVGAAAGYGFAQFANKYESKENYEKRVADRKRKGMQGWVGEENVKVPFRPKTGMDDLKTDLKKVGDELIKFQKTLQSVSDSAGKKVEQLKAKVRESIIAFEMFKRWSSAKIGEAWNTIKEKFNAGAAYLQGKVAHFVSLGAAIIDGLVEGIKSKLATAKAAIVAVGQTIKSTITGALGIKSPSTVFAGFGRMIVAGLTQGLGAGSPAVSRAMQGVYGALTRPPQAQLGSNVIPFQPRAGGSSEHLRRMMADYNRYAQTPVPSVAGPGGRAAGGGGTVVHFNININGASDPAKTKQAVTEALQLSMREFQRVAGQVRHAEARTSYR